jgi:hypothetical protein
MAASRYLTKSRFKIACECPTKLYYTGKKETYADSSLDDSFLEALAEGGFQVGDLAKHYYPCGHDIQTLDSEKALEQTNALLQQDEVTIFEAAVHFDNLLIRADILKKTGNHLKLIEVKAKSYSEDAKEDRCVSGNANITKKWRPYLEDVAFQKHVIQKSFPAMTVSTYLSLVDKNSICQTDGLNQKFKIVRNANYKGVEVSAELNEADVEHQILREVNTDIAANILLQEVDGKLDMNFADKVSFLSDSYRSDQKVDTRIGAKCKTCQFKASDDELANGMLSGYRECWSSEAGWNVADFAEQTILDIWDFRKKDSMIESGVLKMKDVDIDDINVKEDQSAGLSRTQRQWLQVEKIKNNDDSFWLDREALSAEFASWEFPLNFIDFETSQPAIPFTSGMHPYEGIAFQFSHHILCEDGRIEHANEYLNAVPGVFPNFDFLRQLMQSLDQNTGTIFRYSNHENTYLNKIVDQLKNTSDDIASDREELIEFAQSITHGRIGEARPAGKRDMVDLWKLVKRYYYDPATNGSNSIKAVLPAILNSSEYLQQKYSHPIYGAEIVSLNFKPKAWIELEPDGKTVKDPYSLLGKLFVDIDYVDIAKGNLFSDSDELKDGGAAMMAYSRLQFTEMTSYEREELEKSLLKYCELDTLAMVMIYEGWRELL